MALLTGIVVGKWTHLTKKMDSMSNKIDNMESQMRRQQQQQRFERDMDRACQMGGACISHF